MSFLIKGTVGLGSMKSSCSRRHRCFWNLASNENDLDLEAEGDADIAKLEAILELSRDRDSSQW